MNKKILFCDDDNAILEVVGIVLKDFGYSVKILSNFKNFFKIVDNYSPNLIILDLWMPDISGEDITKKLKSNPKNKSIPVIILSASKNTHDIAQKIGADGYLLKPFDIFDLEKIVEKHIGPA